MLSGTLRLEAPTSETAQFHIFSLTSWNFHSIEVHWHIIDLLKLFSALAIIDFLCTHPGVGPVWRGFFPLPRRTSPASTSRHWDIWSFLVFQAWNGQHDQTYDIEWWIVNDDENWWLMAQLMVINDDEWCGGSWWMMLNHGDKGRLMMNGGSWWMMMKHGD